VVCAAVVSKLWAGSLGLDCGLQVAGSWCTAEKVRPGREPIQWVSGGRSAGLEGVPGDSRSMGVFGGGRGDCGGTAESRRGFRRMRWERLAHGSAQRCLRGGSCATHATNHDAATSMLSVSARVFCAVLTLDAVQWRSLVLLLTVWVGGCGEEGNQVDWFEREVLLRG
jgi:hypothetical protein